ncbi:MAG TPA: alpha,alpha-trehalose-phosphate synthase (UDP-forming) [bacterium]
MPRGNGNGNGGAEKRLVIVSNRLPVSIAKEQGRWAVKPSSGGLVTALGPVLRNRGGIWIGWPGVSDKVETKELLARDTQSIGYTLAPVPLSDEEMDDYYYGFSNEVLWPLCHSLSTLCNYEPRYWAAYREVNRKFATVIADTVKPDDYLWVHDYHLMHVGRALRQLGVQTPVGFFLHIPFPSPDIYQRLPWRVQVLEGLLQYDLLGFQTELHKRNFLNCVRAMIRDVEVEGRGQVVTLRIDGREVRVGNFPIGIDYESFAGAAESQEVTETVTSLRNAMRSRCFILGVDRLDYTKGIPHKLEAMRNALQRYPELHGQVTFIQVVVPSRREIPSYDNLKNDIERKVGEINGEFAEPGWVPIQYTYRSLKRVELLAYYRAAQIMLVTPLEDGMNLVAKEYAACSVDGNNVLVLSEFAGAAAQLRRGALLVNPYDTEGMADAIYRAYKMDPPERQERIRRMKKVARENNIFTWVESFLQAGSAADLKDFPVLAEPSAEDVAQWWDGG